MKSVAHTVFGWGEAGVALACSPNHSSGLDESCLALSAHSHCDHLQVFEELDKTGKLLTEEAQDGGFPVHDGKGDLRKCPYYAEKLGRCGQQEPPHVYGRSLTALTVLSVFWQARQHLAAPVMLPWPWRSSPWCS